MTRGKDISVILETIRAEIGSVWGSPCYSERLPEIDDEKAAVVYLDDKKPWFINDKLISLNLVIAFRYKLSDDTALIESEAQNDAFQLFSELHDDNVTAIIGDVHLLFQSVECGYEKNLKNQNTGRYIVNLNYIVK